MFPKPEARITNAINAPMASKMIHNLSLKKDFIGMAVFYHRSFFTCYTRVLCFNP